MTTRPELRLGRTLVPGVLAVILFALMALITLNTGFAAEMAGFPEVSITAAIGYALLDLTTMQAEQGVAGTERFLVSFILVAIVLDAALDASLVLAKREEEGEAVTALSSTSAGPGAPMGAGPAAADGGRTDDDSTRTDGGDGSPRTDGGESAETPAADGDSPRTDGDESSRTPAADDADGGERA